MHCWKNSEAAIWYYERLRDFELSNDCRNLSTEEWVDQAWDKCARQNTKELTQQKELEKEKL
jgi:hypothetical protein